MYKISLSAVNVPEETYPLMEAALREGKIGQTEIIEDFENLIAKYVGADYCVATCSGTMADAVAVAALAEHRGNIKTVYVPALTFIAQINSVRYNNLPVRFLDLKEDWSLDIKDKEDDSLVFGVDLLGRVSAGYDNIDLEDACEAFGSRKFGMCAGRFADIGTFSFFPSHTISTGEGGAIVTDDYELAELCRSIRSHGVMSSNPMNKFHFSHFGFNARMSSLNAVLGISLMNNISEYVAKRRENYYSMQQIMNSFWEDEDEEIVPHGFPIEFENEQKRDEAMLNLLTAGIECRKFFSCIPLEEPYYKQSGSWPVAEHLSHTHLYVPCHQNLDSYDIKFICDMVKRQDGMVKHDFQSQPPLS